MLLLVHVRWEIKYDVTYIRSISHYMYVYTNALH